MEIRKLDINDIEAVAKLHQANLDSPGSKIGRVYLIKFYRLFLVNPKFNNCFVALNKNKIIGVITTTTNLKKVKVFSIQIFIAIFLSIILGRIKISEIFNRLRFEIQITDHLQKSYLYIVILFVDKKFQRQGISRKLVEKIFQGEKNQIIYVDTYLNNKKAIKFYKALNFKKVRQITDSLVLEYKIS